MRDIMGMAGAITTDPETMHGIPVFRGTRVPVQTLFDYLEGGETLEDFLEGFPAVSRDLAIGALEEAKRLLIVSDPGKKCRVHSRPGYRPSRSV
jgi:uncharacterized protein (DUF433 family)